MMNGDSIWQIKRRKLQEDNPATGFVVLVLPRLPPLAHLPSAENAHPL
jgi:hypothetical protein